AMMASQVFATLQQARRFRTMVALARQMANGPSASATMPGGAIRVDEMAMYYVIIGENMLKQHDAVLRDGEAFMRRFPTSMYFQGAKSTMDFIIREKHEVEQGKEKITTEMARLSSDQRWNLCRVATEYTFAHQYPEAQRLFHACFAVGGVDKHALPQ